MSPHLTDMMHSSTSVGFILESYSGWYWGGVTGTPGGVVSCLLPTPGGMTPPCPQNSLHLILQIHSSSSISNFLNFLDSPGVGGGVVWLLTFLSDLCTASFEFTTHSDLPSSHLLQQICSSTSNVNEEKCLEILVGVGVGFLHVAYVIHGWPLARVQTLFCL